LLTAAAGSIGLVAVGLVSVQEPRAIAVSGARTYLAKSTAADSLAIVLPRAEFRSKATLLDIANPDKPVSVAGNLVMESALTDSGKDDAIGVTLWNGSNLVFSSHWTGAKTLQDPLTGGSIVIH
jgi:hypothetical protein